VVRTHQWIVVSPGAAMNYVLRFSHVICAPDYDS
jgi:hypothetical protein